MYTLYLCITIHSQWRCISNSITKFVSMFCINVRSVQHVNFVPILRYLISFLLLSCIDLVWRIKDDFKRNNSFVIAAIPRAIAVKKLFSLEFCSYEVRLDRQCIALFTRYCFRPQRRSAVQGTSIQLRPTKESAAAKNCNEGRVRGSAPWNLLGATRTPR